MRPISPSFAAALKRSHRSTARLVCLDPSSFAELATFSEATGYAVSGSVAAVRGRAMRRTCEVALANPDGELTPAGFGSLFYFGSLIRLDRGLFIDDRSIEWVTLGHFLLGRPLISATAQGSTIALQGEDRAKLLVRSRFVTPTTYAAGARIAAVIQTEAQTAGMGATRYRLDDAGKTLTRDRTFEEDENRIDALGGLARDYGFELFVDADGYLTLAPPPDPMTAPIAWAYASSSDAIHLGVTRELTDDRLYNHTIATGESAAPELPPVRGEAMDTNPASPARVSGPLGDRVYRYTSPMLTTTAQAQEVAQQLLREVALVEEAIELPQVVNPALEPGDAVTIDEPVTKTAGRYLIDEVHTPLGQGEQTLQTKVARALS